MTLHEDLDAYVSRTFGTFWTTRNGQKVPDSGDIASTRNDAVNLDAVVLYADLRDSTGLVRDENDTFAAEIYKSYIYCAARVIENRGGVVTAYDGDRVMGVYIGDAKNSNAARAALEINYAVKQIIQPSLEKIYGHKYTVQHKVGIDRSDLLVANTGIRGNTDLVWVGTAANNAAKLATLSLGYSTYASEKTYLCMNAASTYKDSETKTQNMWTYLGWHHGVEVWGSNYWWGF